MRAAAEVDEAAVAIEADLGAGLGELGHEVGLHEVAVFFEFGESLFAGFVFADEGLVACDDFGHLLLDGGEVFGGEGLVAVEVVEEAGVGGGAVAELGFRKELEDRGGEDVRGGVTDDLEGVGIVLLDELEVGVGGEGRGEVDEARRGCIFGGVHGSFGFAFRRLVGCGLGIAGYERSEARDDGGCGEARRDVVGDVEGRGALRDFADGAVGEVDGDGWLAHVWRWVLPISPEPRGARRNTTG